MQKFTLITGAIVAFGLLGNAAAHAAGDAKAGEQVFKKCMACHAVGPDAKNKIGPALNGIVGEKPGAVEGYKFSSGFQSWAEGKPGWNTAMLTKWLANPRDVVKGTKMSFPGLKKPEDITNVITYLAGFDEQGAPRDPAAAISAADAAK